MKKRVTPRDDGDDDEPVGAMPDFSRNVPRSPSMNSMTSTVHLDDWERVPIPSSAIPTESMPSTVPYDEVRQEEVWTRSRTTIPTRSTIPTPSSHSKPDDWSRSRTPIPTRSWAESIPLEKRALDTDESGRYPKKSARTEAGDPSSSSQGPMNESTILPQEDEAGEDFESAA